MCTNHLYRSGYVFVDSTYVYSICKQMFCKQIICRYVCKSCAVHMHICMCYCIAHASKDSLHTKVNVDTWNLWMLLHTSESVAAECSAVGLQVPTAAKLADYERKYSEWVRFQAEEVTQDYGGTPAVANPSVPCCTPWDLEIGSWFKGDDGLKRAIQSSEWTCLWFHKAGFTRRRSTQQSLLQPCVDASSEHCRVIRVDTFESSIDQSRYPFRVHECTVFLPRLGFHRRRKVFEWWFSVIIFLSETALLLLELVIRGFLVLTKEKMIISCVYGRCTAQGHAYLFCKVAGSN